MIAADKNIDFSLAWLSVLSARRCACEHLNKTIQTCMLMSVGAEC